MCMTESEKIFRSYFKTEKSWLAFLSKHRVERRLVIGIGDGVAVDRMRYVRKSVKPNPVSYNDKPAYVGYFYNSPIRAEVVWFNKRGAMHRLKGPAKIVNYSSGRTIGFWYKNARPHTSGKEVSTEWTIPQMSGAA